MSDDQHRRPGYHLKTLLRQANLTSATSHTGTRLVAFTGAYRDWTVSVKLSDEWFTAVLFMCAVPAANNLRAELFEAVLRLNQRIAIVKFSLSDNLMLEAEYRAEHVDAETVGRLIGHMVNIAEENYPRIFRIASGDALLEALEKNSGIMGPP